MARNFIRGITLLLSLSAAAAPPCRTTTFASAPHFAAGNYITSLVAADFNGDGHPDLLAPHGGIRSSFGRNPGMSLFLNDGRGNFSAPIDIAKTLYVNDAKAIDFDRDGLADIVVTEEVTGALIVFANRRGSFVEAWRDDESGSAPAVGDFNGDGRADLARRAGAELVVLAGGNGTFTKFRFPEPAGVDGPLAAGDLDRDGRDDLVESAPEAQTLYIRRGSAAAALEAPKPRANFQEQPWTLLIADFDGSGYPDIVTPSSAHLALEVLHDPGVSSHLSVWQLYGAYDRHIAADVTGDGIPDLVSFVPFGRIVVGVLGSNLLFETQQPSWFALPANGPDPMAAADFDGDGRIDLAVANFRDVAILFNRGGGRFAAPPQIGADDVRAVVDLNGDGISDLIAGANPIVWFGNGDGTYRPGTARRPDEGDLIEVADLDGDGDLDIVVAAHYDSRLWILRGRGDGSFATTDLGSFGKRPSSLAVVDVDRDGKLDVVVGNEYSDDAHTPVTIAYGRGDGTFETPVDLMADRDGGTMRVADVDGDGRPDIFAADFYAGTIFFNRGGREFRALPIDEADDGPLQLADMNGDGKADLIAITQFQELNVRVRLGRGDGTFGPPIAATAPVNDTSSLDVADLNGDGFLDVVLNDYTTTASVDAFAVLFGTGDGRFAPAAVFPSTGGIRIVDINGDGRPDIMNGDAVRLNLCNDGVRRHAAGN